MLHEPASVAGKDLAVNYKSRLGIIMFVIYLLFYVGFVAINLINPLIMESTVVFGLNLAVVYGIALIIVALILALVYDTLCRRKETELNSTEKQQETH
jgi:uncharacterized membrane protein (DUF485 family)